MYSCINEHNHCKTFLLEEYDLGHYVFVLEWPTSGCTDFKPTTLYSIGRDIFNRNNWRLYGIQIISLIVQRVDLIWDGCLHFHLQPLIIKIIHLLFVNKSLLVFDDTFPVLECLVQKFPQRTLRNSSSLRMWQTHLSINQIISPITSKWEANIPNCYFILKGLMKNNFPTCVP